ncbi:MAG: hypothetical protein WC619_04375 [Patescibacteria group bacterium]
MENRIKKSITEEFVERAIIKYLSQNEWGTNLQFGGLREKGVDIKVRHNRYSRYFLIECKGEGKSVNIESNNSHKEVAFIYSLGQIITRMKIGGSTRYYFGLGLPESSAKIALRRLPWQVAKKLLLYIFSVDKSGKVKQYSWQDLKKNQK